MRCVTEKNCLENERLLLEPLSRNNSQFIAQWATDPRVTRFLGYETVSPMELQVHIKTLLARNEKQDNDIWIVFHQPDHAALGQVALHLGDQPERYAVGYEFQRSAWNCGYATEAVMAVLDYAFTQTRIAFVYGTHDRENIASGRVLEHCGMEFLSQRQGCDVKPKLLNRTMIRRYITREMWTVKRSIGCTI